MKGIHLPNPQYVDTVKTVWVYDELSSHLIQRLKFHEDFTVLPFFIDSMVKMLADQDKDVDVIIPVPLHYTRLFKRGFNQSQEIAKRLAKKFNLPCDAQVLRKIKKTKAQAELHLDERSKNLQAVFAVNRNLTGMNIALIDDVITTGSTVNEIAKVLKTAGARQVSVWGLAHTLKTK